MTLPRFSLRLVENPLALRQAPYGPAEQTILNRAGFEAAQREITSWPGYAPTPLVALRGLAAATGVARVWYKDEGKRFHLNSFKALGGAYAVLRLLQRQLRTSHGIDGVSSADLIAGRHRDLVSGVTVACATDGNHGRSVAWGAQMFGCRCVIYLHEHVSQPREDEIARFGAEIHRTPGSYDDSVRDCAADAAEQGWFVVSDTSWERYTEIPKEVMQGYTVLVDEVLAQLPKGERPTHTFVQAGVGGFAAAVFGYLWLTLGAERPRSIVVEPERADCVYRSIAAGRPTPVSGEVDTFMACLAAGEISLVAWEILKTAADDVIALPDQVAPATMRLLADGLDDDPPIVAGESGCAGVAALIAVAGDRAARRALGLGPDARVLLIGSEGATDEETYGRVVGRPSEEVSGVA